MLKRCLSQGLQNKKREARGETGKRDAHSQRTQQLLCPKAGLDGSGYVTSSHGMSSDGSVRQDTICPGLFHSCNHPHVPAHSTSCRGHPSALCCHSVKTRIPMSSQGK